MVGHSLRRTWTRFSYLEDRNRDYSPQAGMRLRIGALIKIQARQMRDSTLRDSKEMGEVLEEDIHEKSRHARITHWGKDIG